ncbi:MAG: glutaredoxin family protein [Planctomycetaceae bacterium]
MASPDRVTLYTIPGLCPLCDEARAALQAARVDFTEIDIRTDRALLRAYRLEIPVVEVNGRKSFVGRVDLPRLRALLEAVRENRPDISPLEAYQDRKPGNLR